MDGSKTRTSLLQNTERFLHNKQNLHSVYFSLPLNLSCHLPQSPPFNTQQSSHKTLITPKTLTRPRHILSNKKNRRPMSKPEAKISTGPCTPTPFSLYPSSTPKSPRNRSETEARCGAIVRGNFRLRLTMCGCGFGRRYP